MPANNYKISFHKLLSIYWLLLSESLFWKTSAGYLYSDELHGLQMQIGGSWPTFHESQYYMHNSVSGEGLEGPSDSQKIINIQLNLHVQYW